MKLWKFFKEFVNMFLEGSDPVKLDLIFPELLNPEVRKNEYCSQAQNLQ